ncbi:MAG TPA: ribosome maturation factor RimM [Spirochaetota bacterium]|nr:ribosome maturation factor RimM [Spirochaetota bacterium]HOH37558.1 ribosome maturation factor RimM [Spirochaetota bacterium]HPJ15594.1 ribosome maturation factor RimM [Spirochaetota bacterium]
MDHEFIRIAKVLSAHSLKGALKIFVITDIPERFERGSAVFAIKGSVVQEYIVESFSFLKGNHAIVSFEGLTDRTSAEKLKGFTLAISKEHAERTRDILSEDEFYYSDLIGASAYRDGVCFGKVVDIIEGAGDILVIENSSAKQFLLPFVDSMVDVSRLKEGRIDISPVDGLFEE